MAAETFYVRGFVATAITSNQVIAQLWNPSASRRIRVVEVACFETDTTGQNRWLLTRSTARGTASNTFTPGSVDADDNAAVPPSGALLDIGFSVQPTLASPDLYSPLVIPASSVVPANGFLLPLPRGIWVPPGAGLCVRGLDLTNPQANHDATFTFED